MTKQVYNHLCLALAKATSASVRLYDGEECSFSYSVYNLKPDPAVLFLPQLLNPEHQAGVITTPLYQFYGFFAINSRLRIIIGPTRLDSTDMRVIEQQMFLLGVQAKEQADYIRILRCAPVITAERMSWMLAFLATSVLGKCFEPSLLDVNIQPQEYKHELTKKQISLAADSCYDFDLKADVQSGYEFETLMMSYIENGEPQKISELFDAMPNFYSGQMAADNLRQIKNTGICAATLAARAAIKGGMDSAASFRLSDLYIQKLELLRDAFSLEKLRSDLIIDYAYQVQRLRYSIIDTHCDKSRIFLSCADYVSKNIYNPIRAGELAKAMGYTRTYLCNRFKQLTGFTLTRYILQEKVLEAQRMLEFTDKSLTEIANLFSFSSQSHFQSVFKQISGETPKSYRQRKKPFGKLLKH